MLVTGTSAVGISQKSWPSHLKRSSLNLGNWPVPNRLARIHQEGRQHFGVAVLAGVHVEHEIDERALQLRAQAPVQGEARAGDLGGALEIQDAQFRAQVPVRLGLEIELRRLAHAPHFHVVVGVSAHRHGFVRHIGDAGQQFAELLVQRLSPVRRGRRSLRRHGAHLLLPLGGVGARRAAVCRSRRVSALRPAFSCSACEMAARRRWSSSRNCSRPGDVPAGGEPFGDTVEIIAEEGEIVHSPPC